MVRDRCDVDQGFSNVRGLCWGAVAFRGRACAGVDQLVTSRRLKCCQSPARVPQAPRLCSGFDVITEKLCARSWLWLLGQSALPRVRERVLALDSVYLISGSLRD